MFTNLLETQPWTKRCDVMEMMLYVNIYCQKQTVKGALERLSSL